MKTIAWAWLVALTLASCGGRGGVSISFTLYWSVSSQDLDGDGRPDLVYTSSLVDHAPPHPGYLSVALQDPANPGRFLAPTVTAAGADPTSLIIADVDGDGRPDIVVGNSRSHRVEIFLQDPGAPGRFKAPFSLASSSSVNGVAAADLDGNGTCDIAVADGAGITLYAQSPGGGFGSPIFIATGESCGCVAIGDLDGDGRPDLAATTASQVLVLLQNSAAPGAFLAPVAYGAGVQPNTVVIADLNQDGKPDLAISNSGPPEGTLRGTVTVLLQGAPGTFLAATSYTAGYWAQSLAVGDLNGDGKPDLAVGNDESGSHPILSIYFQDPGVAGSFALSAELVLPKPGSASGVAIVDVDGDGAQDVLLTGGSGVTLLPQNPAHPGLFLPPVLVAN